jgi:hypothetical protein
MNAGTYHPQTVAGVSVPGTILVVLRGGPAEWDGRVCSVVREGGGVLERWDHVAGRRAVWVRTEDWDTVPVIRERRGGNVVERKSAAVYTYVGSERPD